MIEQRNDGVQGFSRTNRSVGAVCRLAASTDKIDVPCRVRFANATPRGDNLCPLPRHQRGATEDHFTHPLHERERQTYLAVDAEHLRKQHDGNFLDAEASRHHERGVPDGLGQRFDRDGAARREAQHADARRVDLRAGEGPRCE